MNRTIKFRAWDNKNKRMYYQGEPDLETIQSFFHHYNENDILMQFTGLTDKNGKEIYEGDIIDYYDWTNTAYSSHTIGEVVYHGCDFSIYHKPVWSERYFYGSLNPDDFSAKKRTVIGNIYENKELLK